MSSEPKKKFVLERNLKNPDYMRLYKRCWQRIKVRDGYVNPEVLKVELESEIYEFENLMNNPPTPREKVPSKWKNRKPWEEDEKSQEEIDKEDAEFYEGFIPATHEDFLSKEYMERIDPDEEDTRPVELRKRPDISIDYDKINIRGMVSDEEFEQLRRQQDDRHDQSLPRVFNLRDECPFCGRTILECTCPHKEKKDDRFKIW